LATNLQADLQGKVMPLQVLEANDLVKLVSEEETAMSRVQNLVDELRAIYQLEAEILQGSADCREEISKANDYCLPFRRS
jgi:hypothetical protein